MRSYTQVPVPLTTLKDHLVEKIDEFVDNGTTKARYRKVGFMTQ